MRAHFIIPILVLASLWSEAKDFVSAPDRGILISVKPDRINIKSIEGVKFSGSIKALNKEKSNNGNGNGNNGGKNDKESLLEEFQKEGFSIVGTFPSDAFDMTNNLELTDAGENEIKFSFTASNVVAGDLNQFSVKVYANQKKKGLLARLAQIKSKIQRRVSALQALRNRSKSENWSAAAVEFISIKTAQLALVSQQISMSMNANENLLAENTYALQVDNIVASSSQASTLMNKYRFVISAEIGTLAEGLRAKINGVITNIRKVDDIEDGAGEDDLKIADFIYNGQYVFTSPAQRLTNGQSISYEFLTPGLVPANDNIFLIALYNAEVNKRGKRIGYLSQIIPVFSDRVAPEWLSSSSPSNLADMLYMPALSFINLGVIDSFGRIDENSFTGKLTGILVNGSSYNEDVTSKITKIKIGDGSSYNFIGDLNPLEEGIYSFEVSVKDFAKNVAVPNPYKVNFKIDRTKPAIAINFLEPASTNQSSFEVPVVVNDVSATTTEVYVNDVLSFSTALKQFTAVAVLTLEGNNFIQVKSKDIAGNVSTTGYKIVTRDTTPAILSNVLPENNGKIYQMLFPISGNSNKKLKYVKVNGHELNLSLDKMSFTGSYMAGSPGDHVLNFEYSDVAGNVGHKAVVIKIENKLLNADLIHIGLTADGQRLSVNGLSYASRPGVLIKINGGLFSFNRAETKSNSVNGSFTVKVDYFETAYISATDLVTGQTEEAVVHFDKTKTKLSGIIKDINDNPLPGANVKIAGASNSYITDGNGVFTINNPPTGDQFLVVDGSTIPQAVTTATRKFFTTNVAINVGIGQNNVLERPIYLAPLLFDNSETNVVNSSPVVVTSEHAPGVALSIPLNTAVFPGGGLNGAVNIMKVPAQFATIAAPSFAVPTFVYSFEPSGLVFNQRVQLTLPNENELPPGVEFLIYSMNSAKGVWELDGLASVSTNGQSVVTKAGHGISHFSLVYAVPLSPLLAEVKNPNLLGVDISQGAVSSSIKMPSFRSLGTEVAPSLSYKSSWANPTAVTTNIIDIPEMKSEVSGVFTKGKFEYKSYKRMFCTGLTNCVEQEAQFLLGLESVFSGTVKSWYEPEEIKGQFYISDIASESAEFKYVESTASSLGGPIFNNVTASKISPIKGKDIPRRSLVSFGVELFNPETGRYLASGIYPTLTRYQIKLKNMTMLTGTNTTNVTVNGSNYSVIRTVLDNKIDSKILENTIPKDILSSVLVQSKAESNYGRGWNFDGVQKILNTSGSRILVENEGGSISTYALNNTISTLVNANGTDLDLKAAVDLTQWPSATLQKKSGNAMLVAEVNLTNGLVTSLGQINADGGLISSDNLFQCTIPAGCNDQVVRCNEGISNQMAVEAKYIPTQYGYKVLPNASGLVRAIDGRVIGLDNKQHSLFQLYQNNYYPLAGLKSTVYNHFKTTTGQWRLDKTPTQMSNYCKDTFGNDCSFIKNEPGLTKFCTPPTYSDENPANLGMTFTGTWEYCPASFSESEQNYGFFEAPYRYSESLCQQQGGRFGWDNPNIFNGWAGLLSLEPLGIFSGNIGIAGFSGHEFQTGVADNPTSIGLNNPRGLAMSAAGHVIVADFGNNRVRLFNLFNNSVTTIAGTGGINDSGDGNPAQISEIFHPKELVFDGLGNLYISTEAGYIRKVDLDGKISTFAGLPLNKGGILGDDVHSEQMAFNNPGGMVIDKENGFMYVADTGNHRVVKIDMASKNATTVAGNGNCDTSGLSDNSPALAASLCSPTYVGLDNNKNLLVVDSGHGLIRRVIFNSGATELIYLSSNKDSSKLIKHSDGSWLRTYRNGNKAYFNSKGSQTSMLDRVGRTVNFEYNSEDLVTAVVSSTTGQRTELSYTGSNKLSQIRDPANRITSFNYSGDNLASVNFPNGLSKRYEYNAKGMLLKETNERNISVSYTYNAQNRIDSVSHNDGSSVSISDTASQTVNSTDVPSDLKNSGFGPTQVNDRIVDARSAETEFTKDFMGIVSQIKDAQGNITKIEKDIEGKVKLITHPDLSVVEMTYNELTNDLLSTRNVNLNISQSQVYNQFGQVTRSTNAKNQTSTNTYDASTGLLIKQTSFNGAFVSFAYYTNGLLANKSVNTGSSTLTMLYEYDSRGNLKKITDSGGKTINYVYDLAGNVHQSISSSNGTDQLITTFTYDDFNRIKSVKTPKNETTQYDYLATGELSQITDPQGNTTTFEYDSKGRLSKKTSPDNSVFQFIYDANGNRTQEIDPNGNVKNYTFNQVNKLTQVNLPDDTIAYTYDLRGEIETAQNTVSAVAYQKDPKGRVTQMHTYGIGELSDFPDFVQDFGYDSVDNLLSMQSTYGSISYTYDNINRLATLSNNSGDNFNFGYDNADRLTQIARPNGYTNFTYNSSGSVASLSHFSNSNALRSYANYEYDQRNFQTVKRTPAGDFNFSYDGSGQLTRANNPYGKNEFFNYDSLGNRVNDDQGNFAYDQKLQKLQSDYQYNYFYDNNGNLIRKFPLDTTKTAYKYSYSSTNQLVKVEVISGILGQVTKTIDFKYDVLGRRMQKKITDSESVTNSFTRRYVYNGSDIFAEFDGFSNMLAKYTHSPLRPDDVLAVQVSSTGVSAGLAQSSGKFYYLKDLLGSVTDISDASGNVIQKYEYSAYGKIYAIRDGLGNTVTNIPVVNTSFTYTGREWDSESGMYYYRARYYDPSVGRFLQQDPHPGKLAIPATFLSKYTYTGNNPVMYGDPSGMSWVSDFFGGSGGFLGDIITAAVTVAVLAACGVALPAALIAVGSVAGGAAVAAGVMAAFQGGNFLDNFSNNFHSFFRVGATFLAASAVLAPGGIASAGGNGLQGYIVSNNPYFGAGSGLTIGSSATFSSMNIAAHEFSHTLQFIGIAGLTGAGGGGPWNVWQNYLAAGTLGSIIRFSGVPDSYNPIEFYH